MTTEFFSRYMLSKIAQALGTNEHISHDALDNLWMGFGDDSKLIDSTKAKKANEMVEKIAKKNYADDDFIQIINEVFYHDARSEERRENNSFKLIEKQLQKDGFVLDENGLYPPNPGNSTKRKFATSIRREEQVFNTDIRSKFTKDWETSPTPAVSNHVQSIDSRKVFIVHGRDMKTKEILEQFLRYIEVSPLDWAEARRLTRSSSPTTLEIVQAGLNNAQAIVVVFTPDDEAKLKNEFHHPFDGSDEVVVTGQARQNVILEAGMALGIDARRTILVRRGKTRDISDIAGMHWLNLTNDWDDRMMLVDALESAGVTLNKNRNMTDSLAGSFD